MNLKITLLIGAALLFSVGACHKKDNDELSHHHEHDHTDHATHSHAGHSHAGHNHAGHESAAHADADVIELSPEVAARFGLSTERVEKREIAQTVKVGATVETSAEGQAIVSAPVAGVVTLASGINVGSAVGRGAVVASIKPDAVAGGDANRIAKADLDAAQAEFERIDALYADRLVTAAEYTAAKAALQRAKAAYSAQASTGQAASPIAGVITSIEARPGEFVEAGAPIATVAEASRLIVRAMVPARVYRTIANAADARATTPEGETFLLSESDGRRLGSQTADAASGGYVPVTFSVKNNGRLIPGESITIHLLGASGRSALTVPATALTEKQGTYFVYEQLDEDCYRKRPVTIGSSDGRYVEVLGGLNGGENIVAEGVTAVKLAETAGAVPEGHTHSH